MLHLRLTYTVPPGPDLRSSAMRLQFPKVLTGDREPLSTALVVFMSVLLGERMYELCKVRVWRCAGLCALT